MKRLPLILSLVIAVALPVYAYAISLGAPYGGLVTVVVPCTCSGGLWMQYTPYFYGIDIPATGALYIPPAAVIYEYFQLLPGTWELGSYIPGVGECLVTAPNPSDPCILLPTEGTVDYTGTSSLSPVSLLGSFGL